MDVTALVSGTANAEMVKELTGLAQAHGAADLGTAMLDQILEVQQQLASQLLQSMGVGGNLDVFA
jgi:hypothetical protein